MPKPLGQTQSRIFAKIPGLENAGPQIESAVNKMLVPAEQEKPVAGYFEPGHPLTTSAGLSAFHSTYSFQLWMLNSLAMIPDNIIDFSQIGVTLADSGGPPHHRQRSWYAS